MKLLRLQLLASVTAMTLSGCGGGANSPSTPESVTLSPAVIAPGGTATLTWNSTGSSCQASGAWSGSQPTSGSKQLSPSTDGIYTYTLSCSGGPDGDTTRSVTLGVTPSSGKIKHVIIIYQENRTPDNLFHGLPGADIANSGINSAGQTIVLQPGPLANNYDLDHSHIAFEAMYDGGKMDGADKVQVTCAQGTTNCPPANPSYFYVNPSEVAPYFQLAEQYTFGDRMFQTNQGPSFPAHQFIISGTSAPSPGSPLYAAENPNGNPVGCNAASDVTVNLIDPMGDEHHRVWACFEHQTVIDTLDEAAVSWRYYTPFYGFIWTGPNAIKHLRFGPDWSNVIVPETSVLNDISSGTLPQMVWIIPSGQASDHASVNDGSGPSWVASIVNAVGNSAYWNDTAIFITWDDWGGWYDHVAPTIYDSYEYGFRVPLIVVSPYAKHGYVSHVIHDTTSILKFIEENFGLPSLGYADARADDLQDCFDFSQTPSQFQAIPSRLEAQHFLSNRAAPLPPDDD